VRLAAVVPELHEQHASFRMDGIGDAAPARDVRVLVDAGRAQVAAAVAGNVGRFGDDQATLRGALAVVGQHHRAGTVVGIRAQARGRRVHDAVRETGGA
jgi:hypothetical protein